MNEEWRIALEIVGAIVSMLLGAFGGQHYERRKRKSSFSLTREVDR